MIICNKDQCTGCFSCMSICPNSAISVGTDTYGKTVPVIDDIKCIECGACIKSCPVNRKPELYMPLQTIAAWSKTEIDVEESSSGGAAAVFSRKVLQEKGVVYGAASINGTVKHIRVTDEESIQLLRGSKYVQSYTGTVFQDVKQDLKEGKFVLFTGVPCQISGLKAYLKRDYDNLITVDLICHGTPPFQYLKEHIENSVKSKWDSVSFRGKRDWFLSVYMKERVIYSMRRESDLYFKAFLDQLSYRDNCYVCSYANPTRCADITIGDFWGIDRSSMKNQYNGRISLVLLNTQKGNAFWKKCSDCFVWEERTLEEAMNPAQGNLLRPSKAHAERETFLKNYQTRGFDRSVAATQLGREVKRNKVKNVINKTGIIKLLRVLKHKIMQ